jgi:hypothetical protein
LIGLTIVALVLWVVPITWGVRMARRKNYSPLWMLVGIHPLMGWIALIVLACLPRRRECSNCGGFPFDYFRICPYCQAKFGGGSSSPAAGGPPAA